MKIELLQIEGERVLGQRVIYLFITEMHERQLLVDHVPDKLVALLIYGWSSFLGAQRSYVTPKMQHQQKTEYGPQRRQFHRDNNHA